jgi:hypothetical protein
MSAAVSENINSFLACVCANNKFSFLLGEAREREAEAKNTEMRSWTATRAAVFGIAEEQERDDGEGKGEGREEKEREEGVGKSIGGSCSFSVVVLAILRTLSFPCMRHRVGPSHAVVVAAATVGGGLFPEGGAREQKKRGRRLLAANDQQRRRKRAARRRWLG